MAQSVQQSCCKCNLIRDYQLVTTVVQEIAFALVRQSYKMKIYFSAVHGISGSPKVSEIGIDFFFQAIWDPSARPKKDMSEVFQEKHI